MNAATASAPGAPEVTGVTNDSVELTWARPKSDGGARIQGYRVEQRPAQSAKWEPAQLSAEKPEKAEKVETAEKGGKAEKPMEELCYGTSCSVHGLPTGEQMVFRVVPVNAAGPGEPSQPCKAVTVQEKPGNIDHYIYIGKTNID